MKHSKEMVIIDKQQVERTQLFSVNLLCKKLHFIFSVLNIIAGIDVREKLGKK